MRESINAKINLNITNAQKHQKRNFDNRHSRSLSPGATVYIKNSKRILWMGLKMEPRWMYPYKIIELLEKGCATLDIINTGKKLNYTYIYIILQIWRFMIQIINLKMVNGKD